MGPDTMVLISWMLCFKAAFSVSSFTLIKRLFSFSLLSVIGVVSSAYLRLLIFLLAILILECDSFCLEFYMMYSAYKPWRTAFPIWNQSVVPCPVITVASWPAYRFSSRQVRWSGIPIFKNFPQFVVSHTVKGFSVVSETEVDVFLEFLCFLSSEWCHLHTWGCWYFSWQSWF